MFVTESFVDALPVASGGGQIIRDTGGFAVFADADDGAAHVTAHVMLDQGRTADGHSLLGRWLRTHRGHGARWVHLQWHMAVFEVELGLWQDALARFVEHILPAVSTGDALTDAPSLLWHLKLESPAYEHLPWEEVREAARKGQGASSAYVELHHLLALAGAGDASGLDAWLMSRGPQAPSAPDDILVRWAMGLRAFVARDWVLAAKLLEPDRPGIRRLGGSKAQNRLFERISQEVRRRADRARTQGRAPGNAIEGRSGGYHLGRRGGWRPPPRRRGRAAGVPDRLTSAPPTTR